MRRLLLGVDPCQRKNAYAWQIDGEPQVHVAGFNGIENVVASAAKDLAPFSDFELWAVIECPTWSGNGTKEVRSAAISWERVLHQMFENRHVCRVDPRAWQGLLLKGCPGETTKERAFFRARNLNKVAVSTDDEADAVCLLEYSSLRAQGMVDAKQEGAAIKRRADARRTN